MALGGRPKEEGGHERVSATLNVKTIKLLDRYTDYYDTRSKTLEAAVQVLQKEKNPKKRRRLLKMQVKRVFDDFDDRRTSSNRSRFFNNFNEGFRDEAIALWLFTTVDELLHCFKIASNINTHPEKGEILKDYLESDLERHVDYLREGFLWIAENGNQELLQYLKGLHCNTRSLYANFSAISNKSGDMKKEKMESSEYVENMLRQEEDTRGIERISAAKPSDSD